MRSGDLTAWRVAADAVDEAMLREVRLMAEFRYERKHPSGDVLRELEGVAVDFVRSVRTLSELIGLVLTTTR